MTNSSGSSYIFFGGYEAPKTTNSLFWVDLEKDGFWSTNISTVKYGNDLYDSGKLSIAQYQSGSFVLQLPTKPLGDLIKRIDKNCTQTTPTSMLTCTCKKPSDFDPLKFVFKGEHAVDVPYWNYVGFNSTANNCIVMITQSQNDITVLGIPFLKDNYVIFDAANAKIGFGKTHMAPNSRVLGALAVLFLCVVCCCCLCICCALCIVCLFVAKLRAMFCPCIHS